MEVTVARVFYVTCACREVVQSNPTVAEKRSDFFDKERAFTVDEN
jgi:hypothetical protein